MVKVIGEELRLSDDHLQMKPNNILQWQITKITTLLYFIQNLCILLKQSAPLKLFFAKLSKNNILSCE